MTRFSKFAPLILLISALCCTSALAQGIPIGALPSATTPLSGGELTILSQNGVTVKSTVNSLVVPGLTIPSFTLLGNNTASSAEAAGLTVSQVNTMLGLGTAAFDNTGTSGGTIPLLNGVNTWSGLQTFSGGVSLNSLTLGSLTVTGQITDSVATGTAPFVVSSTTNVANLNASSLTGDVIGTSGGTIPLLNAANTWSGVQKFTNSDICLLGSSTGCTTFTSANSGASNFTTTFPAATSTVGELGVAGTWTAVQTFTNSDFCLLGSSTGCTTFTSANSGASNFTLTFPAATDTIADLAGTQTFTNKTMAFGSNTFSGQLAVASGGTGISSGTSGGILAYTATGTLASSGALTAGNPVVGGGAGAAPSSGARLGNTTTFATTTGTFVSGNCVQSDSNHNLVDAGATCSSGTVINSIQQGTITATNTATITSVNTAKAFVIYEGVDSSSSNVNSQNCSLVLTSATVVSATCGGTGTVGFTVVEFK